MTLIAETLNGGKTHLSSGDANLNFFFQAGASRTMQEDEILHSFQAACDKDKRLAFKTLLWARDCRGGAGERRLFNVIASNLLKQSSIHYSHFVYHTATQFGSWKDVFTLEPAYELVQFAAGGIVAKDGLCCKWMPRKGPWFEAVRKYLRVTPKDLRQHIVKYSNTVEQKMCSKNWIEIDYKTVPSVAMSRYKNTFSSRDPLRYGQYIQRVLEGKDKMNASVAFPHDVLRNIDNEAATIAQWESLPDLLQDTTKNILPVCDVSGSMCTPASGSVSCMDICVGMGLYIAERQRGQFKNMFMTFSSRPELQHLTGDNVVENMHQLQMADWGMNTDFRLTFMELLDYARMYNVSQELMPEIILVFSDMEFDQADRANTDYEWLDKLYAQHGYKRPQLVFWNLNARPGNVPVTVDDNGTALVSGYSPNILRTVLSDNMNPYQIMLDTVDVDRYTLRGLF